MIPSHGLVVVRLGKYSGAGPGGRALNRAFELLMEAVPALDAGDGGEATGRAAGGGAGR
jgi:hypothetical protein